MKLLDFYTKIISYTFCLLCFCFFPCHATIDFKPNSIIVDDEIEETLTDWISQLFRVAGLKNQQPNIYLIVNSDINAAATVGGTILIHTGLIIKCETSAQFLGVLAHEVGHIAGGHVLRSDEAFKEALVPASAAMILGGALALATGNPSLLAAGFLGSGHAFERSLLKYSRTQEISADHAAVDYLHKLGWGTEGLRDFFHILDQKMGIAVSLLSPYEMTHPLTADRKKAMDHHVQKNPGLCPSASIERAYQRLRGKIIGFFEPTSSLLRTLKSKKLSPEGEKYAKTIALYRMGQYQEALTEINNLKNTSSNTSCENAWYEELKGQILFDTGRISEAVTVLDKVATSRPQAKYIKILLAHALLEENKSASTKRAKEILIPLTQKDQENVFAWRLLAQAHGKENEPGLAALALAEEALQKDDIRFAQSQTQRAIKLLPPNSSGMQRAKDILQQFGGA